MNAVCEALALFPDRMDTPEARVMIGAIQRQEDPRMLRRQMGNGPARGLYQFERLGGVIGVMRHAATRVMAERLCAVREVEFASEAIWSALEFDDVLAAGFARLLLWSDPFALPAIDDAAGGWALYMRTWRPGKPHPRKWAKNHADAVDDL